MQQIASVLVMGLWLTFWSGVQAQGPRMGSIRQEMPKLMAAAALGHDAEVRTLLAGGEDVNEHAADRRSALIMAAQNGRASTVRMLIGAGADLNYGTQTTGTALEVAESKDFTEISAMLLEAGARSSGKSPGDTVCVLPWKGDGFCGVVRVFTVKQVQLDVTKISGCAEGCVAREACSASRTVGGTKGIQRGDKITVPSWCLTQTRVTP